MDRRVVGSLWFSAGFRLAERLFRTSDFPRFLALVEVSGDFRRQIWIQHVEIL